MSVQTPTPSETERPTRFAGVDNATAGPFRAELVSLLVMTANGQADARSSCPAAR
jgi:hypothetical protein